MLSTRSYGNQILVPSELLRFGTTQLRLPTGLSKSSDKTHPGVGGLALMPGEAKLRGVLDLLVGYWTCQIS